MIRIDIPGFGPVGLEHLVIDFSGTLSVDGRLVPGAREQLNNLAESVAIHVLTADTHGKALPELEGIACETTLLEVENQDGQKEDFVKDLGAECVVAIGNGNNDRKMLASARVGIAVCLAEGCAIDCLSGADVLVTSVTDALGLLLKPDRLKATLRY
jgi:soluble P-type ATPase